jgi:hypothetical protein
MDEVRAPIPHTIDRLINDPSSVPVEVPINFDNPVISQLNFLDWGNPVIVQNPWHVVGTSRNGVVSGRGATAKLATLFFEELLDYLDYDKGMYHFKPRQNAETLRRLGNIFGKLVYREGYKCFYLLHPTIFRKQVIDAKNKDPRTIIPLYKYYFPDKYHSLLKVQNLSESELDDMFQEKFSITIVSNLMATTPERGLSVTPFSQGISFYLDGVLENDLDLLWVSTFNIKDIPDDRAEPFKVIDDIMVSFVKSLNDDEYINLMYLCTGIPNGRLEEKITVKWEKLTVDFHANTCERTITINEKLHQLPRLNIFFRSVLSDRDTHLVDKM